MFRSLCWLGLGTATLSTLAVGCGAVESPASPAASTEDVRRCDATTAPFTRLDDVVDGQAALGACGDLMFTKADGSLWLRKASGDLVMLDEKARPGSFDATGTVATYDKSDDTRRHVLFDLATLTRHELDASIMLGYDEETRTPLAFGCKGSDLLVWNGATFVAHPIAKGVVSCREHAPLGATMIVQRDGALGFVDVKHATVRDAAVDYRTGTDDDERYDREDIVYLSRDGRVALYREVRQSPCGDTYCEEPSGTDVLDTATGKVIAHWSQGLTRATGARVSPDLRERRGALVMSPYSGGKVFSLDTKTLRFVELTDTRVLDVLDGLRIAYVKRDTKTITLATTRVGSKDTSTIAQLTATATTPNAAISRDGKHAIYIEQRGCVRAPSSPSCQAAATWSDLVVWRDGKVVHRVPNLNALSKVTFTDDGHALFFARWFTNDPPAEGAYDTLSFDEGMYELDPAGSLRKTSLPQTTAEWSMRALSTRWIAREESAYDGRERTTSVTLFDRDRDQHRTVLETTSTLTELVSEDGEPVRGVVAYSALVDGAAGSSRKMTVWHGVP